MLQTNHPILATLILMAGENYFPSSTIAKMEEKAKSRIFFHFPTMRPNQTRKNM
jgi:hypothetical protein